MGMTIDKAKNRLENYYDTFCGYSDDGLCGAIYTAINTMRKYQKIEQIYREWFSDTGHTSADAYVRIGEVLEDGNDN